MQHDFFCLPCEAEVFECVTFKTACLNYLFEDKFVYRVDLLKDLIFPRTLKFSSFNVKKVKGTVLTFQRSGDA